MSIHLFLGHEFRETMSNLLAAARCDLPLLPRCRVYEIEVMVSNISDRFTIGREFRVKDSAFTRFQLLDCAGDERVCARGLPSLVNRPEGPTHAAQLQQEKSFEDAAAEALAEEVEQRLTIPMEKLLYELPGVEYIYSTSMPGSTLG